LANLLISTGAASSSGIPWTAPFDAQVTDFSTSCRQRDVLDAQSFYDRFAPLLSRYSANRATYLARVNELIIGSCGQSIEKMLDVGCGDGSRAVQLAAGVGSPQLTLLDQSVGMLDLAAESAPQARLVKRDIGRSQLDLDETFDLVTCLWNVLGHVSRADRTTALRNMRRVLTPTGRVFLDVNNRYNIAAYGWRRVAANRLRDALCGDGGDVVATVSVDGTTLRTYSHLFEQREMVRLVRSGGFYVRKIWSVDYQTGCIRGSGSFGQLLFELVCDDARSDDRGSLLTSHRSRDGGYRALCAR